MADESILTKFGHAGKSGLKLGYNLLLSPLGQAMGFETTRKYYNEFDPTTDRFAATKLAKFSPQQQHHNTEQYKNSYKLHVNLKALDSLETYKRAMHKDFSAFIANADITEANKTLLWEKLPEIPMRKLTDKFDRFREDFNTKNKSLAFTTLGVHAWSIDQLEELKNDTKVALKNRFDKQINSIDQFNLGGETPRKIDKFKQDWRKALTESYEKESKALEESMTDNIKAMHLSAQHERDRINELARMYTHGPESVKLMIKKLIDEEKLKLGTTTVTGGDYQATDPNDTTALLKHIDLDMIRHWETGTGLTIHDTTNYDKEDEKGEKRQRANKFSIEFPNRITGFMYYNSLEHNLKVDMMSLASAVKSRGFQSITMNITPHRDPDTQKLQIKLAYDACIENGFDPKKITIKVGGKVQNLDDIEKTKDDEAKAGSYTNKDGIQKKGENISETRDHLFKQRQQQAMQAERLDVKSNHALLVKNTPHLSEMPSALSTTKLTPVTSPENKPNEATSIQPVLGAKSNH